MITLTVEQRKPIQVWQSRRSTQWFCRAAIVCSAVTALWVAFVMEPFPGESRLDNMFGSLVSLLMGFLAWRFGLYPRLIATQWGLIVKNPMYPRRVPWKEVVDLSPSQDGIDIERTRGWPVTVWCVQQGLIAMTESDGRTRAERVIDEIRALATEHGAPIRITKLEE